MVRIIYILKNLLFIYGNRIYIHIVPTLAYEIVTGSDTTLKDNFQGFMIGNTYFT